MNSHAFRSQIIKLISAGDYKISEHALDALLEDELKRTDVQESVISSEILEYYPEFGKGPAILLY